MNQQQQTEAFANDLKAIINRYRSEFHLTVASAIGTLEVIKLELFAEQSVESALDEVDDGWCLSCGNKLQLIRPGKHQCPFCE